MCRNWTAILRSIRKRIKAIETINKNRPIEGFVKLAATGTETLQLMTLEDKR